MPNHPLDAIDPTASRLIRAKVRRLIASGAIPARDREDFHQDFAADLLARRPAFDPARATWEAYVIVITENFAATVLAARRAAMRSPRNEAGSLNEPTPDADGRSGERGDAVPADAHARRLRRATRTHVEAADLRHDVARVLNAMSASDRAVGEALMAESPAAAARRLDLSRSTIYTKMASLRTAFGASGLRDYL